MFRYAFLLLALTAPVAAQEAPEPRPDRSVMDAAAQSALDDWASAYRGRALVQGVPRAVLDPVLDGLTLRPEVVAADRDRRAMQQPVWTYFDTAITEERIEAGRAAMARETRILEAIESRYGVEPQIIAAIWGIESDYGRDSALDDGLAVLASLAEGARRPAAFEAQLTAALKIVEAGDVEASDMSAAIDGTMGQTGLLPTTLIVHGVDFDGDGRRDVWDDSADALATTAAFLSSYGWVPGQPWGVEVTLPDGFDYGLARRAETQLPSEWAELGVTGTDDAPVDDFGPASILLPAGAEGAAFLIFPNFSVLERYDATDAWPLAVGLLSDGLTGGDALAADWPRDDRILTEQELTEMQRLLTQSGFDTFGIDGRVGP